MKQTWILLLGQALVIGASAYELIQEARKKPLSPKAFKRARVAVFAGIFLLVLYFGLEILC